jgi:DNA-binding NtrC family response regulator
MTGALAPQYLVRPESFCGGGCCGGEWIAVEHLAENSKQLADMVIRSERMLDELRVVSRIAPYKTSVLIHGESGTGKELVARALHSLGPTPNGPLVVFNCSNLVDSLAESQLFGHVRGSFTDARTDSPGYFRSANGGTLFLDEIGELPLALQPKLLRAVETREIQPVGSPIASRVDLRIIAATNRDLGAMVAAGKFRADLYYRLNGTSITIPRLADRPEDIDPLIAHFVRRHAAQLCKPVRDISRSALAALRNYDWPGNVRQLAHIIETALMMTDDDRIGLGALPALGGASAPAASVVAVARQGVLFGSWAETAQGPDRRREASLEAVTRQAVMEALEQTQGHRLHAARLLGISRARLYRMLERYDLADFARPSPGARSSIRGY